MNTTAPSQDTPVAPTAANLGGSSNIGNDALIPTIIFTVLATIVVGLRWYTRCQISHCIGLDDYVILFALVSSSFPVYIRVQLTGMQLLSWTMCIIVGASVFKGIGSYGGYAEITQVIKLILSLNCLWIITINVTKASILTQYLRIFSTRPTRALCYIIMFLLIPSASWGLFGGIFLCIPTAKLWDPMLPGHCRDAQTYWSSVAAVDIALDFAVLILPMPSIAGLHLPRKQKVATVLLFVLGFLVCFVSVVRIATVLAASRKGDFVMSGIWSIIWSTIEANVGIMCACVLSLKPLATKLFPRLLHDNEPNPHSMRVRHLEAGYSDATTSSNCADSIATSRTLFHSHKSRWSWSTAPSSVVPAVHASTPSNHKPAESCCDSDVMDFMQMLRQDAT